MISVAYCAFLASEQTVSFQEGSDASQARWFPVDELPNLAFDHSKILADALNWVKDRIDY